MHMLLKKDGLRTTIIFKYRQQFETAVAIFNRRTYYIDTKNKITREEFQKTVRYIGASLAEKGFDVKPRFHFAPKEPAFRFIRPSPSGGDGNLVNDIQNYYKMLRMKARFGPPLTFFREGRNAIYRERS